MSNFKITKDDIGRKAVTRGGDVVEIHSFSTTGQGGYAYLDAGKWFRPVSEFGKHTDTEKLDLVSWYYEEPEVTTQRSWETVHFSAKSGKASTSVELEMNRKTGKFKICTASQEMVSFDGDTIETAKLKIQCLQEAIKYMEQNP